jgi:hypothetical protein
VEHHSRDVTKVAGELPANYALGVANGHHALGNCHAGPGQPLVIELDPQTQHIVWQFDQFTAYGNSVSNSQLVDEGIKTLR